jgi:putative membrane protein
MTVRVLLAGFHLLALGIGLGAVVARGRALTSRVDSGGLRSVFLADTWWGVAALLWISTGLWRLLAGVEKSTTYYFHNHLFLTKMALLAIILALELWPMMTLIAWRRRAFKGEQPVTRAAPLLARISFAQAGLVGIMIFLAAAMARGYGVTTQSP